MISLAIVSLVLVPPLYLWLSHQPRDRDDVMWDHMIPRGVEDRTFVAHWGLPAGVSRFNAALLTEVKCHPDFVERDIPDVWFKWSAADARKRARRNQSRPEATVERVLFIRKQA